MRISFMIVAFVIFAISISHVIDKTIEDARRHREDAIPRNEIKARNWADALNLRNPYTICNIDQKCAVSYELAADTRLVVGLDCSEKICWIDE